jgi:hypothetical protein
MRLTWLADTLRAAGLKVHELDGWRTRGTTRIDPAGIVCHHTATPATASDATVAKILRDGRPDLKGPLSQLGLQRDGVWVIVAAGRANHNGYGEWGNDSIGVEAYNDGVGEPWPKVQTDSYAKGCAALCRHLGLPVEKVKGHKETDPGRKIDPTFDMPTFRNTVARLLEPAPAPDPIPTTEDRMALLVLKSGEEVCIPLTGPSVVAFGTDGFLTQATGCAARIVLGPAWHAPIPGNEEPGLGVVSWIPAGDRPSFTTVTADLLLVVQHLGRETVPLTVTVERVA